MLARMPRRAALSIFAALALAARAAEAQVEEPPEWTPPVTHAGAMFTITRTIEAALYPDPFADTRPRVWGDHYAEAVTKPPLFDTSQPAFEWDHDPWWINVVGHGLMGSELYLRARTCRFGAGGAFLFATAGTLLWEYAIEANGVRPSGLDLVYTPIVGSVLGEMRSLAWRAAGGIEGHTARGVVRALMDPFGELQRGIGLFPC
jgi:hypothetical protein